MERQLDDYSIVKQILAGQREEYRCLIERHENQVFALLYRQLGDRGIARELTHETFVKAYLALGDFRDEALFSTWLIRIALNCANTFLRSSQCQLRLKQALQSSIESGPTGDSSGADTSEPETFELQTENLRTLRQEIVKLKPKLRDTLTLCALQCKTYQEASEILGVPYGTVCSRMNSALHNLRRNLRGRI